MKADILFPSQLSAADIAAWDSFNIATTGQPVAFLSYPYVLTAEKVFGNVRVCRIGVGGEAAGFFPFQYRSLMHRAFGIGQRVAGELSDYYGLVAKPGTEIDSVKLLKLSRLNAILFSHLDESQRQLGLNGEAPEVGHIVDFPDGAQAFWQARRLLDKKFVSDTERRERRLIKDFGELSCELQSQSPAQEFDRLVSVKREQYARTKVSDPLKNESTHQFLQELLKSNYPLCSGLISTLYAGSTWVASHFGLRCGQTLHYWFPVYNPNLHSYGPGRLLFAKILEQCELHGISRIDRGAGDTIAKRDFSTSTHRYYRGLWCRPGIRSSVYRLGLSSVWKYQAHFASKTSD